MSLSDTRLANAIQPRLLSLYTSAKATKMSDADFATQMSQIIAQEVISEITTNARVSSGIPVSTPDTITGTTTGQGSVQ